MHTRYSHDAGPLNTDSTEFRKVVLREMEWGRLKLLALQMGSLNHYKPCPMDSILIKNKLDHPPGLPILLCISSSTCLDTCHTTRQRFFGPQPFWLWPSWRNANLLSAHSWLQIAPPISQGSNGNILLSMVCGGFVEVGTGFKFQG